MSNLNVETSAIQANMVTQAKALPLDSVELSPENQNNSNQNTTKKLSNELKEITALYNIGVALNSSLNPKEVVWTLYKEAGRLIDASNFALVLYDYRQKTLQFLLAYNQGQKVKPFQVKLSNPPDLTGHVFSSQSPVLVRDLSQSDKKFELNRIYPDKQIRSWKMATSWWGY